VAGVRKAVIPAAGHGSRFLPATKAQPKELIPVVDKPAIQYVVEEAADAGIEDILLITGRGKESLQDHFDRSYELEHALDRAGKHGLADQIRRIASLAHVHTVRQGEAKGLGHAVHMARWHVAEEPFAVLLPDDIMHERHPVLKQMLEVHERYSRSVVALKLVEPSEVSAYGAADPQAVEGEPQLVRILGIVEKPAPEEAPSNLASTGRYVFTPEIFDALGRIQPGKGGELQLTDAIHVLAQEQTVYGYVFEEGRFDVGNKLDYLKATVQLALEREDLGPSFRSYLEELVKREGLI
jgi:UTP--glucose-1-phosphate uridylyltransferase